MTVDMLAVHICTPAGTCPSTTPCLAAHIHVHHMGGHRVVGLCVAWHGGIVAAWGGGAGLHPGCPTAAAATQGAGHGIANVQTEQPPSSQPLRH
jgi:hypothetical protein